MNTSPEIHPLGDQAWLASFPNPDAASAWHAAAEPLRARPGVTDIVLAYASVAVHYDLTRLEPNALREDLAALSPLPAVQVPARLIEIPTLYDGADLASVASRLDLSVADVIGLHSEQLYRVFALGFQPGFPYCGFLPESLSGLARRDSPRSRVPAGSVAIAGRQTGIYPSECPGGWHLLGRTPLTIVDRKSAFFPIRPGDDIRFRAIEPSEFSRMAGRLLRDPRDA